MCIFTVLCVNFRRMFEIIYANASILQMTISKTEVKLENFSH